MSQSTSEILSRLENELLRFAPFAAIVCDVEGIARVVNEKAGELFFDRIPRGKDEADLIGLHIENLFPVTTIDCDSEAMQFLPSSGAVPALEVYCKRFELDGLHWTAFYLIPPRDRGQRELILEKEAATDELSGLANRRAFQRTMEANQHCALSLAIIDIDQFKAVNDTHGHVFGDDVIRKTGQLLQKRFEDHAIVLARMGGDEFSVLFKTSKPNELLSLLELFRKDVCEYGNSGEEAIKLSVSIGVAFSNEQGLDARTLLTSADRELYAAKQSGKNQIAHVVLPKAETL